MDVNAWHLLASIAGVLATVWTVWVRPAHRERTELAVWKAKVEERLRNGEQSFVRHKDKDDEILAKLNSIDERLRNLEMAFAGVAPAFQENK